MTVPRDRKELVDVAATAYANFGYGASKQKPGRFDRDMVEYLLDALEAAGVVPCPLEATVRMKEAGNRAYQDSDKPAPYNQLGDSIEAAIAHTPYRRTK